jgi:hypothetical protein
VFLPTSPSFNLVSTSAGEVSSSPVEISSNGHGAAMMHA